MTIPTVHTLGANGSVVSLGGNGFVGVALNGVPFYFDHEGTDGKRTFDEDFDGCMGHTKGATHAYHYHLLPTCLFRELGIPTPKDPNFWTNVSKDFTGYFPPRSSAPSQLVGWALDGAPIHSPYDSSGGLVRRESLDRCNGKVDGVSKKYTYFLTPFPPYLPPCFRGQPGTLSDGGFTAKACPVVNLTRVPCAPKPSFLFPTSPPLDTPQWVRHSYVFGVAFALLFVVEVGILASAWFSNKKAKHIQIAILCLLILQSFTRALFFLADPYWTVRRFSAFLTATLFTISFPAINSALCLTMTVRRRTCIYIQCVARNMCTH